MYHYVREPVADMPYFNYLHVDDFRRQLDWFAANMEFLDRERFLDALAGGAVPRDGVVLTFDDGFRDHYDYVLPELERRGLWGIFYVSTGVYRDRRALDVHRVHCLLGRLGGPAALAGLAEIITPDMVLPEYEEAFKGLTYLRTSNDEATKEFKRTLNYYLRAGSRTETLNRMMAKTLDEESLVERFYMSPGMIRDMQGQGMIIGSHSVTHPVFSKLSPRRQSEEIVDSFAALDDMTGGLAMRTFCYPYGLRHTFTGESERLLREAGCRFAFAVDSRDIEPTDIRDHPQALPRYDCNEFPHGRITTHMETSP